MTEQESKLMLKIGNEYADKSSKCEDSDPMKYRHYDASVAVFRVCAELLKLDASRDKNCEHNYQSIFHYDLCIGIYCPKCKHFIRH